MEKEKFDKNFVWQDSYDDDQGDRDDKIEEKVEIWVKIGCVLSFCICILHYLVYFDD